MRTEAGLLDLVRSFVQVGLESRPALCSGFEDDMRDIDRQMFPEEYFRDKYKKQ